jgi:hypothetical protein
MSEAPVAQNMIQVRVFLKEISAERFWDVGKRIPPVKVATNLNIVGMEEKDKGTLEFPFVFAINYTPGVAQISVKGRARVSGKKEELRKIQDARKEKKPPPPIVMQSISNVVFLESVIVSRSLNIPPPVPLPRIPPTKKKKLPEPNYRT